MVIINLLIYQPSIYVRLKILAKNRNHYIANIIRYYCVDYGMLVAISKYRSGLVISNHHCLTSWREHNCKMKTPMSLIFICSSFMGVKHSCAS